MVDFRFGGDGVFVVGGGEFALQQADGDHVLQTVISVGEVMQRTSLVDDANAGFLSFDVDVVDVGQTIFDLRVQFDGCFDSGLSVELGGERDLEQDVLHHVIAVRTIDFDFVAAEQDVVEAPAFGR